LSGYFSECDIDELFGFSMEFNINEHTELPLIFLQPQLEFLNGRRIFILTTSMQVIDNVSVRIPGLGFLHRKPSPFRIRRGILFCLNTDRVKARSHTAG